MNPTTSRWRNILRGFGLLAASTALAGAPQAQITFGDGSDGAMNATINSELPTPVGAFTGPVAAGANQLAVADSFGFAAGDEIIVYIHWGEGAGQYEFADVVSVGDSPDLLTLAAPLEKAIPAGSQAWAIRVWNFTTLTVGPAAALTTSGARIFAAKATQSVTVNGSISMAGKGYAGAPGGEVAVLVGQQGESFAGNPTSSIMPNNGAGGGGGGVQFVAAAGGGGGSHGGPGTDGQGLLGVLGGSSGQTYGSDAMTTVFMGSGGGSGGALVTQSSPGAAGGGIVFIASPSITVGANGRIMTTGSNGGPANSTLLIGFGGGGGGAGGSTLLYAGPTGTINNAGQILARGGQGGEDVGTGILSVGDGGDGGRGRNAGYAATIVNTGTIDPPFVAGGGTTTGTGIELTGDNVDEGVPNGTAVGTLRVVGDDDPFDFQVFTLIDSAAGRFGIEGEAIVVVDTSRIDATVDPTHEVTVRATDSGGNTIDTEFVIRVNFIVESGGLMIR